MITNIFWITKCLSILISSKITLRGQTLSKSCTKSNKKVFSLINSIRSNKILTSKNHLTPISLAMNPNQKRRWSLLNHKAKINLLILTTRATLVRYPISIIRKIVHFAIKNHQRVHLIIINQTPDTNVYNKCWDKQRRII